VACKYCLTSQWLPSYLLRTQLFLIFSLISARPSLSISSSFSLNLQSRNVELGKFAPKLAAAETALARAKANAQLASESQADLRASFNAGIHWMLEILATF